MTIPPTILTAIDKLFGLAASVLKTRRCPVCISDYRGGTI